MEKNLSVLSIKNLAVSLGGKKILHDVNMQVTQNSLFCLLGPSGVGKSTLLLTIAGLLKNDSSVNVSGKIQCDLKVGFVFQKSLPFRLSIFENVALALREKGFKKQELEFQVEQALKKAGLWKDVSDRLQDSALQLSGGQQQRLCLARTLALKPELLLMDEPCSSLDPMTMAELEQTFLDLKNTTTLVLVTHNLAQAKRVSTNLNLLWDLGMGGVILDPDQPIAKDYLSGRMG